MFPDLSPANGLQPNPPGGEGEIEFEVTRTVNRRPTAIVGMGCFFPQSSGLRGYLRLLINGRDAVGEVPPTHWSREDYFDPDPRARDRVYCARGGFLTPVDFDPTAFGIPPTLLEATDTSQLLALLAARAALEDMGLSYDPARTSVILGVTGTQELVIPLSSRLGFPRWRRALAAAGVPDRTAEEVIRRISDSYVEWQENSFPGLLGNVVAGRISNRLNLGGTNCVVDAACASSLAAVHMALLELETGRCDLALSGGVDTLNDIFMHMCFAKTQVLSATGDARPFSQHADGTVLGEGVGIVVLKRLEDAERDGNRIYAVLRGLGSSSDGRSQSIYAPRREGQVEALRAAYAEAGVDPGTVGLIEAHGTGTRVGDRVEFEALCEVFGGAGAPVGRCALGSVKSMIGHTKAAAGVAGLIKAALALHHRVLFPTLKAEEPDPALNLETSPFHLSRRARPWFSREGAPRRAGVSAFGFGGSNFHAVLEEHGSSCREIAWDGSVQIFAFSAGSPAELLQEVSATAADPKLSATGEGWSRLAAETRARFDPNAACRLLFPASDAGEARERLQAARERLARGDSPADPAGRGVCYGEGSPAGALAVLFPGQGCQYPDMGRELILRFPAAREALEAVQRALALDPPLGDRIYPPHPPGRLDEQRLQATELAQPAIGAVSLALWKVLHAFGLSPAAAAGHSFGELTALCAAGRIDEKTFGVLARARGRAMAGSPAGSMAAVFAPLAEVERAISETDLPVVVANRNAPRQAVVSGPADAVQRLTETLGRRGLRVVPLPVSGAFHSPLMAGASREFAAALERADFVPSALPVFSSRTKAPFPAEADAVRRLLAAQMLAAVDFIGLIEAMYAGGIRTFVEIGPRSVLSGLVAEILDGRPHGAFSVDSSSGRKSGLFDLATALCRLGALGHPLDLSRWDPGKPEASSLSRLRIPICGANLGPSADRAGENPLPPVSPRRTGADDARNPEAHPEPLSNSSRLRETPMTDESSPVPETRPAEEPRRSLEEGFEAIRRIHEQTAQAHEKFLDLQRETTQALLELIRNSSAASFSAIRPPRLPEESSLAPPVPSRSLDASSGRDPWSIPPAVERHHSSSPSPAAGTPTAAAAQAPALPAQPATRSPDAPDAAAFQAVLLEVVSRLTGYPPEMLGVDMDIEADLGIDSIKRVEILSALEEKIPGLRPVTPEDMPRLKTLSAMVSFFTDRRAAEPPASPAAGTPTAAAQEDPALPAQPATVVRTAPRRIVVLEPAPEIDPADFQLPAGRKIFVTDDRSGLARAVLDVLSDLGLSAVLVAADIFNHRRDLPPAAGLIFLARCDGEDGQRELRDAFELARRLGPDLVESARLGAAFLTTVSRLDGALGFSGRSLSRPLQGALAGLAKTAAIEWPEVVCHALDLDPDWRDPRAAARALVREALHRGPLEVGLGPNRRLIPRLVRRDDLASGPLPLAAGETVIVSGGARGITAACAVELARQVRPALVLLGRTPEPEPEPFWMQGLQEENEIRQALLREEFSSSSTRPAEAEKRLRNLLAAREVRNTLQALRDLGAPAAYVSVDVRDPVRLRAVISEARDRFGPIRGLIHGAGVLEDRLILDKTLEQFDRVMGTKLGGFLALREALADEELRLLVLFSSVTARFGNRGQADYAMANEALNKLARAEAQRRPGCRVVAVNWGPWDCGMVTPAIRREFERRGVELLSASQGAASLIAELRRPPEEEAVEVVIGGMNRRQRLTALAPRKAEGLRPLIERRLDLESHPVLRAHVLGERAVVPLALIAEWLGEGALHENPGLVLDGLEEIRLLKGIRLEAAPYRVHIWAGKPRARNGGFEVDLELRGGGGEESAKTLHCRARAVLAESHAAPPVYRLPSGLSCNHYPRSPREVYEAVLFHGEALQGLRWIQCCTAEGMVADVAAAPRPECWVESPFRRSWLGDPLALDAAFQMASLWCWEMKGAVCLPSGASSFRLYRGRWPEEGCRVVLEIRGASDRKLRGDFVFLDAGHQPIAQLSGFEAVIDPALNRAFKPGGIRAAPLAAGEKVAVPESSVQSGSRS